MPELSSPFIIALGGFALCWSGLWLILTSGLATRLAVDQPNPRSLHATPVPRVGGVVLLPVVLLCWLILPSTAVVLILLVVGLTAISYLDDRRGLPVVVRLGAQLCAACVLVVTGPFEMDIVIVPLLVIAVVWMTNLYNFMDGADGLAGGMTLFGFVSYGVASALVGAELLSAMCLTVAATALAFLCFNFHPARIFLGDAGSVPLGFLAAAIGLQGWAGGLWPLWFPPLVFSPFVADATVTLVRRLLHGEKVWQAHREHYYQRLVRMGWGHRKTAIVEYGLMIASGTLAVLLLRAPQFVQIIALLAWCALLALLMRMVDQRWRAYVMAMECGA